MITVPKHFPGNPFWNGCGLASARVRPVAEIVETAIEIETGKVGDAAGGKQCHGGQVDGFVRITGTPRHDCDVAEERGAARSEGGHKVEEDSVVPDDDGLVIENWDSFGVDGFGKGEDDWHERLGLFAIDMVRLKEAKAVSIRLKVARCDPSVQILPVGDAYWFIIRETLFVDSISQLGWEFHKWEDFALWKWFCGFARHYLLLLVSIWEFIRGKQMITFLTGTWSSSEWLEAYSSVSHSS